MIQHVLSILRSRSQRSYAQCGEDLIVRFLLCDILGVVKPVYLDLGSNDPILLSNTYLFYRLGCNGVCVDPNPRFASASRRKRPNDIFVQCGVGAEQCDVADFYVMEPPTLSSFSRHFIDNALNNRSYRLKETIAIPLMTPMQIISRYCTQLPNFVSIDVEGHDERIVSAWDFANYRPEVFCVETISHHDHRKLESTTAIFQAAGYIPFADTFINTIYVESTAFERWRSK